MPTRARFIPTRPLVPLLLLAASAAAAAAACSDDPTPAGFEDAGAAVDAGGARDSGTARDGGSVDSSVPSFSVSGTVTGLAGSGLQLQVSANGETITVAAPPRPDGGAAADAAAADAAPGDGGADAGAGPAVPFAFMNKLAQGTAYAVSVKTQPSNVSQTCSVMNGMGTIGSADVTGVRVVCSTNAYSVKGRITGLVAGSSVVLQNNGADDLTLSNAPADFTFPIKVASGAAYAVTVKTQPGMPPQVCKVTNGAGPVTNADITNVTVDCKLAYSVGGSISGLGPGKTIVLQNNAGDDLTLTEASAGFPNFTFANRVAAGDNWAVTIKTAPAGRTCTVTNGSGMNIAANVSNVQIACTCASNKVLLLGEGSAETDRFEAALNAAGLVTTKFASAPSYANVPAANTFNAIVVLVGNQFESEMNGAGQSGIVAAQAAGTGIVHTEWGGYHVESGRWRTLAPTLIRLRTGGNTIQVAHTIAPGQEAHPIWAGLPATFTTVTSMGISPANLTNGGSALATCPQCGPGGAVAIKDSVGAAGRIAQAAIAPGWNGGSIAGDTNTTRMYTNMARWVSKCD